MGRYEVLRESASGLEMPDAYTDRLAPAQEWAIDLAHDSADGGFTGRSVIRNGYDEAIYYVRVRGPLTLIYDYGYGDLPFARWHGEKFDYYAACYSHYRNREFLKAS